MDGSHIWVSPFRRQWKSPGLMSTLLSELTCLGNPNECFSLISRERTSKFAPSIRLAVPAKQRSTTSSARPTASKICAPL